MPSFLAQLQQDIAEGCLAADPFFAEGVVIWEQRKDVASEVARIESQVGWGVLVMTPTANTSLRNLPTPFYDEVKVVVQCYVNTATVPAGSPSALEIAERVAQLLSQYQSTAVPNALAPASPTLVPTLCYDGDGRVVDTVDAWTVNFSTSGGGALEIPMCAAPEITEADGLVTITCATAGAAVFYATDGKLPIPRTGTLYTAPFATPASGTPLRAKAWLAGYLPSKPARLNVP